MHVYQKLKSKPTVSTEMSNAEDKWASILESLSAQCNEHKVSDAFQQTLCSDLIDKALIPIVKEAPASTRVYPPDSAIQALTVHFGWSATTRSGVRLTVYRHSSSLRMTVFIVCSFVDETSFDYKAIMTEKEVAEELKLRLDGLRKQDTSR